MEQLLQYWPIGVILLLGVVVTGIAAWRSKTNPKLNNQEQWGIYLWFTPLAYPLLTWFFVGTDKINQPVFAVAAIPIYILSAVLLFWKEMPKGLQWHYPIGAACLLLFFLS